MKIVIVPNERGHVRGDPPGKLADAELHFGEPLAGLKLIGFSIWEGRGGNRNVTFPARQYSVNGERRSFTLLRPIVAVESTWKLRDAILAAYELQTRGGDTDGS